MDEYISREAALACVCQDCRERESCLDPCVDYCRIKDIPAADVRPVAMGRWKHDGSDWKNRFICDQCGYKWFFEAEEAHFCPNCGCAMENEK